MKINKAGIYQLSHDQYNADPAPEPSLRSSLITTIWNHSLKHGWINHPRLNPGYKDESNNKMDHGSAAHDVLLEGGDKLAVIDGKDWRTKAAKEAKETAYAQNKIPVLKDQAATIREMVKHVHEFISETELAEIFTNGKPEQSIFAQYNDVWVRSRPDWLTHDRKIIIDYKTTTDANPETFARKIVNMGYDIQAALAKLINGRTGGPEDCQVIFLVQETDSFECSLVGASPSIIEAGERKIDIVTQQWREALQTGHFPGYGDRIAWAECPPWELARIEERELQALEES